MATQPSDLKGTMVVGSTSQGVEFRATPVRLARYGVVFELCGLGSPLQASEALKNFKIVLNDQAIYSGRAVVKSLLETGPTCLCEATLEDAWIDAGLFANGHGHVGIQENYDRFLSGWQKSYKIRPEYKVVAADMQTFLTDLRLWIEQIEIGIRSSPAGDRAKMEREAGIALSQAAFPAIDTMFEKFELLASKIEEELQPVHRAYIKRQVHPLVLCSPFAYRTVTKPLGYAGDYEVVNMLLRDPHEGPSLFGKVLNRWFIKQPPAEAHRNRIKYLTQKLYEETARLAARGKTARIFNLGCGPAQEIQDFLARYDVSDHARFTLLDFNEETIRFATTVLSELKSRHHRGASLDFVKKSVGQVLKGRGRKAEGGAQYDFVYCAGLFDYLSDAICEQLLSIFYDILAPGGLLVATNVDVYNPIRYWLGDILEWHLIYRNGEQFRALAPAAASPDEVKVVADATGVNVFLEVRKPAA
jgi:extracellular factor (EF) 3-hydroxypalmitic acid methyl ester biosynthesis protein